MQEPFVGAVNEMIDRLVVAIADAKRGFRLWFSAKPFAAHSLSLTWLWTDPIEGNWYRADDIGDEGWLCPALFLYFADPPPRIFVRAEPRLV